MVALVRVAVVADVDVRCEQLKDKREKNRAKDADALDEAAQDTADAVAADDDDKALVVPTLPPAATEVRHTYCAQLLQTIATWTPPH